MDTKLTSIPSLQIEVIKRPDLTASPDTFVPDTNETEIKVGRDRNSHIYIDYPTVSQKHLTIRYIETNWFVIDNSTNGTFINQKQLPKGEPFQLSEYETLFDLGSRIPQRSVRLKVINKMGKTDVAQPDLYHDRSQMRFYLRQNPVKLPIEQYRLLLFMYENLGDICSHERIGEICWGSAYNSEDLDQYAAIQERIFKLRKVLADTLPKDDMDSDAYEATRKLIKDPYNGLIVTHRGYGYELRAIIADNHGDLQNR